MVRDLERAGFEVRTVLLGAHHVGAPHRRDRIWIVGRVVESYGGRREDRGIQAGSRHQGARAARLARAGSPVANPALGGLGADGRASGRAGHADERGAALAHPEQPRRGAGSGEQGDEGRAGIGGREPARGVQLADADLAGLRAGWRSRATDAHESGTRWPSRPGEPQHEWEFPRLIPSGKSLSGVGGVASWFSAWMDRLALVPISHILMGYATPTDTVHPEAMRSLREDDATQAVLNGNAGGSRHVSQEEVLRCQVHGRCKGEATNDALQNQTKSAKRTPPQGRVRTVRNGQEPPASPLERGQTRQPTGERRDTLRNVPREVALEERKEGKAVSAMLRLRESVKAARTLPEALVQVQEVWRSAVDEKERWATACAIGPCVAERLSLNKRNALKALGNSVVPACAEVIGRAIMDAEMIQ